MYTIRWYSMYALLQPNIIVIVCRYQISYKTRVPDYTVNFVLECTYTGVNQTNKY